MELTPKISFGSSPLWNLDLTVVLTTTVTCILVLLITMLAVRKRSLVPRGLQTLVEMVIELTRGMVRANLDSKTSERFYGFAFTLFLFILIANQLGLMFNLVSGHGEHHYALWKSPTADFNVPVALAIVITLVAHFLGIKKTPKEYVSHYFKPFWPMFPLHIVDEIAKPMTHGLRLWANIFAGEVLIIICLKASPFISGAPLVVWLGYSMFVGLIQAYVFTVLAIVYMSLKINSH